MGEVSRPLVFSVCAAVLGSSFQFGYHTGVINAPQDVMKEFINETHYERSGEHMGDSWLTFVWSMAVSIFAIGGMIGSLTVGYMTDRFGRKGTLLLNNVLAVAGCLLMGFSKTAESYEMLIVGRLIIGINCGINTGAAPLYITELSPVSIRGAIGITNQLGITTAILLSQILGLPVILGTDDGWPYLLALSLVNVIWQLATLPFCPESPKYLLINRNRHLQAEKALEKLRGTGDVNSELSELKAEYEEQLSQPMLTWRDLFSKKSLRDRLIICIVLQLSQQLSGINAVLYYSTSIFIQSGLSKGDAPYATLGSGGVIVLMTLVSVPLIERLGRRTLHLVGVGGMFVNSLLLATTLILTSHDYSWAKYVSIVVVVLFTVFFAIGPGSIPWFYPAELFHQNARPAAMSVAILVNWMANFIIGIGYLPLQDVIKEYTFFIFAALLLVFWIFTYWRVPETKNKSINEVSLLFEKSQSQASLRLKSSDESHHKLLGSNVEEEQRLS